MVKRFLLNKNEKTNKDIQEKITIELENEIFKQMTNDPILNPETNDKIAKYIPELEQTKIRIRYLSEVAEFSGKPKIVENYKKIKKQFKIN